MSGGKVVDVGAAQAPAWKKTGKTPRVVGGRWLKLKGRRDRSYGTVGEGARDHAQTRVSSEGNCGVSVSEPWKGQPMTASHPKLAERGRNMAR